MLLSQLPEIDTKLRPYQSASKKAIYSAWETSNSVLFQMPTGTGKTYLFCSIIRDIQRLSVEEKRLTGEKCIFRVLVLAHRTELIDQIDETLKYNYGISHGIIKSGREKDLDPSKPVQVASVQTLVSRLDSWRHKEFSYIVIDEAHHAVASTYMEICRAFPNAKILGVTATPCRLTGDALRKLFSVLIVSQPINKFIEQGFLSPYQYYSIKPESSVQQELDGISHFNIEGDYAEADMMRVCDTNKVRANIVAAYEKYAKGKKGIIYTINQKHNKHICEEFEKIGIRIKAIDSKTPPKERKNTVADFKAGAIDILCNVNIFSEGFDCPDCEFIQLARPTCSLALYLQQVGRGLRPFGNKQAVILDNVGSYNKFGLPSANRKWRKHFEGEGQRVTASSISTVRLGNKQEQSLHEGDEDMMLIYNGTSLAIQEKEEESLLDSIVQTKEWFPFGAGAMLEQLETFINVRALTKAMHFYNEYTDEQEWKDNLEDEIITEEEGAEDEAYKEKVQWVEKKIWSIFKFQHDGKYGLCQINCNLNDLENEISLCKSGEKNLDEVLTILLSPEYDIIGIPDDADRAICLKGGKYGVISGESFVATIPFIYDALEFQTNGMYLALKDDKVGLIKEQAVVLPFEYEEILDLTIKVDEKFYMVKDSDYYRILHYKGQRFITQQKAIAVKHHLIGKYYIGLSIKNFGFICDENGRILYPLYFERIGYSTISGVQIALNMKSAGVLIDEHLDDIRSGSFDSSPSLERFIEEFGLEKTYSVVGKNINENKPKQKASNDSKKAAHKGLRITKPVPTELSFEVEQKVISQQQSQKDEHYLPAGVFKDEDGHLGYDRDGVILINPEYDSIVPYENDRFVVTKAGKQGVLAIIDGRPEQIGSFIFNDIVITANGYYRVRMPDGSIENLSEDTLKSVVFQTDKYLIVRIGRVHLQICYHGKRLTIYKDIIPVKPNVFIVQDDTDRFGVIECRRSDIVQIKPFEYKKIELSPDKRNLMMYKESRRARVLALSSIGGE